MAEKACDGGRVLEYFDMAECSECGTRVRWDLQDHSFWGFQNCESATKPGAVDPVGGLGTEGPRAPEDLSSQAIVAEGRHQP